jgi:RNA polymerase sigma-70 factor (ECF subfamily)
VLIAVGLRWSEYDRSRPLRPWLFAFALRVASSWRRSARATRESLGASDPDGRSDEAMSAHEAIESRQRRQLVIDALQSLDESKRAVFVMVELEGLTVPEVAAALSVNLNTVYSRLRLARAEFTEAVRRLSLQRGAP